MANFWGAENRPIECNWELHDPFQFHYICTVQQEDTVKTIVHSFDKKQSRQFIIEEVIDYGQVLAVTEAHGVEAINLLYHTHKQ